nr:probable methyltransferase PMT24 isoform X1 [Ziziphus jujuba var. spinosa]XP_015888515.2 probable methyltransferase PMT24 isoform X1 [Ziziphus jujuba var. spinosa]
MTMALGKYSRADGRKPSSCCSTVSVVVFVAFCLVGVWMLMSSVVPVQNQDLPSQETINKVKRQVLADTNSKQFEDTSGDLPEDATNDDGGAGDSRNSEIQNIEEHETSNTPEENQEEVALKEQSEVETESQNDSEKSAEENSEDGQMKESENDGDEDKNGNSNSEAGETNENEQSESEKRSDKSESDTEQDEKKLEREENDDEKKLEREENDDESKQRNKAISLTEEKLEQNQDSEQNDGENTNDSQEKSEASIDNFSAGAQSELLKETNTQNDAWSTQATESQNEKELLQTSISKSLNGHTWKICNVTAGPDYIPCLDNWQAIKKLPSRSHYQHRERHCPDEGPTCLVSLPEGYKSPVKWPASRDKIWYNNVPNTKLAVVKGHQNWVKVSGEYLIFPGGGTQFKNGALHYIDFIQKSLPNIAWGKRSRVILDVGCGVASFGGFLFERDVLAMSFAPKDEHEAQVQFALERGIPAISAVMGTKRLPFPSAVFDVVHCARCRVPWHLEGGKLLLELDRLLRPGGYFVWSATPVYQKLPEDVGIWKAMTELTKSMCWDLVVIRKDKLNDVAAAFYRKPTSNDCYNNRRKQEPPLCSDSDDPDAAWNVPLEPCIHKVPEDASKRGSNWPAQWPSRLEKPPYWLKSQRGVYGKAAPEDFTADYKHWKNVVSESYLNGLGINWSSVRNIMDMRAVYGGFAAALKDLKVWIMNVVPIDNPDTLPIIFERGLTGMYHDWCESFSTYPRTYDLLHADHLFADLKKSRCNLVAVMAEVDRILRPEGKLIVRDNAETINELESIVKSLKWDVQLIFSKDKEGLLCVQKTFWRPAESETLASAIA